MPEKRFDPKSRTVYLDTSTISHAYNSAPAELGRLRPWIETIARNENLCVSFTHAAEFGDLEPDSYRTSFVAWTDALPIVWAMTTEDTEHREVESFLKVAVGMSSVARFHPFRWRGLSMAQMIECARREPWDRLKFLGVSQTKEVRDDIEQMRSEGVSAEALEAVRQSKTRAALRQLAREAHARLRKKRDVDCYLWSRRKIDFEQRFVELYERDPTSFRTFRVSGEGINQLGVNAMNRDPGGKKELGELAGFTGDVLHAMAGAAYCDVFTCDRLTSAWVAPLRTQFGLAPPIVLGGHSGGPAGFVGELIATSTNKST